MKSQIVVKQCILCIKISDRSFADTCTIKVILLSVFFNDNHILSYINPIREDKLNVPVYNVKDVLRVVSKLQKSSYLRPDGIYG